MRVSAGQEKSDQQIRILKGGDPIGVDTYVRIPEAMTGAGRVIFLKLFFHCSSKQDTSAN
jgi:hypothetical protein